MTVVPTVFIDATAIPADLGGVGRYVEGLVKGLSNGDTANHLIIAVQARHAEHFAARAPRARIVSVPRIFERRPLRLLWEQFVLPRLVTRSGAAVLHSPHYTFPLLRRGPLVVTLHDATFFSHPEVHSTLKRLFFRTWIRLALTRTRICIVPSRATATELRHYIPRIRSELHVAYHGVDAAAFHPPTADEVSQARKAIGLADGQNWIAFLGTIEPRKNLGNLIRAYAALRASRSQAPELVIVGARGWDRDAIQLLDAQPPAAPGVHEVGYLPLELLAGALGGATVVAYPSLGEGFGLPVLEAMATGACVLTTPRLALPEVGGDAVAYSEVDALSIENALSTLLEDPGLRHRLGEAARTRAAAFNWNATAVAHKKAYLTSLQRRTG